MKTKITERLISRLWQSHLVKYPVTDTGQWLHIIFPGRVSSVAEVPRGLYMPVSHSLIVCWRVPSSSASLDCVSLICRRSARTPGPSHLIR